jgi:hypothetical protein
VNFGFAILDFGLRRKAVRKIIQSESLSVNNLKSKIQNLKWVGILTIAFTIAFGWAGVSAQQTGKIFRIGFLDPSTTSGSAVLVEAFRQEMRRLGWIEGKNIAFEYRFAEQKLERLPELAADLIRGQEGHYYHTHRDGRRSGSRGCRFGCQPGAAGRQCYRSLKFVL